MLVPIMVSVVFPIQDITQYHTLTPKGGRLITEIKVTSNNKGVIHLLSDWDSKFSSNQEQIQKVNLIASILGVFFFICIQHADMERCCFLFQKHDSNLLIVEN